MILHQFYQIRRGFVYISQVFDDDISIDQDIFH